MLVVDDHRPFRETAADFVRGLPGIADVQTAASGEEALTSAGQRSFDLVLLDLTMPGMGGLAAARALKRLAAPPRIYIASMQDGRETQAMAQDAGADGFISKSDFAAGLQQLLDEPTARRSS